jgi:hypothetical protein
MKTFARAVSYGLIVLGVLLIVVGLIAGVVVSLRGGNGGGWMMGGRELDRAPMMAYGGGSPLMGVALGGGLFVFGLLVVAVGQILYFLLDIAIRDQRPPAPPAS